MHNSTDHTQIYDVCEQHMHAYVLLEMKDGMETDGIITGIDHENVYVAVPIGEDYQEQMREHRQEERPYGGFPFGGYGGGHGGYGGYGGHGGYHGSYYGRPRRFNRLIIPLAALAAVSLLPWY